MVQATITALLVVVTPPRMAQCSTPAAVSGNQVQRDTTFYYFNPDWSPDGTTITFEAGHDGQLSIYTVGSDGQNLTRLTDEEYNDEGPVWSPDGTQIAFFSNRRARRRELPVSLQVYVMNADGTGQRRLTDESAALDHNISWSPDGTRLVYQSRPDITPVVNSLYVIDADGRGPRQRITDGQHDDAFPQWAPNGNRILYVQSLAIYKFPADLTRDERRSIRASTEIALLNLDDGTITPITRNNVANGDPSWNAAGRVVFYYEGEGQDRTLMRHHLGEPNGVAVTNRDVVFYTGVVARTRLSPNGRFLSYAKEVEGRYGLYVYDLELEEEHLLVGGSGHP